MLQINSILHPTDYSEPSQYALRMAASLARDYKARLVLLHVASTLGPELVTFGEVAKELEPEGYQHKLWDELRQLTLPGGDVTIELLLREGDPAREITRAAQDAGCGLIVMATHGRTGLDRLLMGSVAEQVMRTAPCPVLIVKSSQSISS